MTKPELDRRRFNQLTAAALGGMIAGTAIGCGGKKKDEKTDDKKDDKKDAAGKSDDKKAAGKSDDKKGDETQVAVNDWTGDIHVCRGLNACMNKGATKENACAGQGACATATAHSCHKENDCKFQGGCGDTAGNNACKGKGECGVPLSEGTWKKARASFEAAMNKAEKKFGEAPAKES